MLLSFIDRTDKTAGLSLSLTPHRVVCVWHVVNTDLPSGCLDVWRSVARGRLSVSVSLSFCPSLHLFVRSLLPPSLCLSLNIVFHLVFISFVSFTDDSFPTINRSISQTVWTRTTIFHHTDSLCVWGLRVCAGAGRGSGYCALGPCAGVCGPSVHFGSDSTSTMWVFIFMLS